MIHLYDRDETKFNHNETVLVDTKGGVVEEIANGMYELTLEYPMNEFAKQLTEGKVIKAPTANGDQLFRIYKPLKTLGGYTIYARHIFYDLLTNFIESSNPTKRAGQDAIKDILNSAQIDQGFRAFSDITKRGSSFYVRMNPVEALLGAKNSFAKVWGGELIRNNHDIKMVAMGGKNRGYEVRLGKNLIGVEVETDDSEVVTRIYPTVVVQDNKVETLPEKYVDSPIINNYEYAKIKEERIELTEEENELPLKDIYKLMRDHCIDLFEQEIDKPETNFKINFIELSQTEQYKDLKILEELKIYDTILTYIPELDINVTAKVISTKFDPVRKRYTDMELGSFKQSGSTQAKNTIDRIDKQVKEETELIKNIIIDSANGLNKNFIGPDEPTKHMKKGDTWFKKIEGGHTEIHIYDGDEWVFVISSKDILDMSEEIQDAVSNANDFVQSVDDAVDNAGFGNLDDFMTGTADMGRDAILKAESAINDIFSLEIGGRNILRNSDKVFYIDGEPTLRLIEHLTWKELIEWEK